MKNIKMLLLGDSAVGKTSFLAKYRDHAFPMNHESTIGVDFCSYNVCVGGDDYKVNIWDTAGQESFRAITTSYFRGSNCAIVFFDLCNIDTFMNVQYWIDTYMKLSGNGLDTLTLIGNKKDGLYDVSKIDAESFKVRYREISVKHCKNEDIHQIINEVVQHAMIQQKDSKSIRIRPVQETKNTIGCLRCN